MMEVGDVAEFRKTVWDFYREHGRHDLPWRRSEADRSFDPYKILVSEIMLQQTQVPRVLPKYQEFLTEFPNVGNLARAKLGDVLAVWNGLGHNRRAKFLWQAAQKIEQDFGGKFPASRAELESLAGVGPNTAGAIAVYAFNQPVTFIETNIRTVFIYHFFKYQANIPDSAIRQLVAETIDAHYPREWFWALMDYGSHLKQTIGNLSRASKSYVRQSKFNGSRRQIRGQVIRRLLDGPASKPQLNILDKRRDAVLAELLREGLIERHGKIYSISR